MRMVSISSTSRSIHFVAAALVLPPRRCSTAATNIRQFFSAVIIPQQQQQQQRIVGGRLYNVREQHDRNHTIRSISTRAAKQLLGFASHDRPTVRELRTAYFQAAKRTHPDTMVATSNSSSSSGADEFRLVTEAYERLLSLVQSSSSSSSSSSASQSSSEEDHFSSFIIDQQEEEMYRHACWQVLGISAEIVEESKSNPMFRHWLGGNTDGAQHWRAFFSMNGGLAQKLRRRPPSPGIGIGIRGGNEGTESTTSSSSSPGWKDRRRRKR